MTRHIILDTETTGLNHRSGNRILEIGCVELIDRKLTGNNFHRYINPERDSEEGALGVHGLTTEFLIDKAKFQDIIDEFITYIADAIVVIHNAPFDVGFLNAEFERLGKNKFESYVNEVVDTLVQAKELHPGKKNSLDALCNRYDISNAHRKLHGALLDAELLSDVFLAMSRGQDSFSIEEQELPAEENETPLYIFDEMPEILVQKATIKELEAHEIHIKSLEKTAGSSFWRAKER